MLWSTQPMKWTESAISNLPGNYKAYNIAAQSYQKLGKEDEAAKYFEKAINLDPEISEIYLHLGEAYEKLANKEKALIYYKKYVEIEQNPDNIKAVKSVIGRLK